MVNRVILVGHLGADPEVRKLENGVSVARLNLATNEGYKDNDGNWQNKTEWHSVVAWRYLAERAETSLKKGNLVYLEGKLTTRKWQDQNGADRYTTEVVAEVLRSLTGRDKEASGSVSNYFPSANDEPMHVKTYNANQNTETQSPANNNKFTDSSAADDDLPF
jgi:single-strand DNA-binding protein